MICRKCTIPDNSFFVILKLAIFKFSNIDCSTFFFFRILTFTPKSSVTVFSASLGRLFQSDSRQNFTYAWRNISINLERGGGERERERCIYNAPRVARERSVVIPHVRVRFRGEGRSRHRKWAGLAGRPLRALSGKLIRFSFVNSPIYHLNIKKEIQLKKINLSNFYFFFFFFCYRATSGEVQVLWS